MGTKKSERIKQPPNKMFRAVCRWWERRRRWGEWGFKLPMLGSVIIWAVVIGGVVTGAYLVIYHWVLRPKVEPVADSTILSMALTIAAGTGGLVLLVVNYRKQHDLEESRFVERFGAAAAQLGHDDVAVRLAGVYALVGVAERTRYRGQIQQCIDVLCGYLRLPYEPHAVETHQTSKVIKRPGRDAANFAREKHYKYRQNDEVVRQAIVTVIVAHLQRKARYKWSTYDFNFTGVYFEDANFGGARFSGESVSFREATFSGEETTFERATFSGERTSFSDVRFSGESTSFSRATFSGEETSFSRATFSGVRTSFSDARFNGENTWFMEAAFSGKNTWFSGARFNGEKTLFIGTVFSGERTWFSGAWFNGEKTLFIFATFSGLEINFNQPKQWNPAPIFDWDEPGSGVLKPNNVKPHDWPPTEKT